MDDYPIDRVRDEFPALQRIENNHFVAYFDGPGSTQVARTVIDAIATYMKTGVANPGGVYKTTRETAMILSSAREYCAGLLGANKESIVFGPNMTTLALQIARTLGARWDDTEGNIVVTEIDHQANIDPWIAVANEKEFDIHTIKFDSKMKKLDLSELNSQINEKTKLVAISLASNVIGTINDLTEVIECAKAVDAFVVVDAVHAIPHYLIDFEALDVDFLFGSAYKFFGPHVGFVAIKEEIFEVKNEFLTLENYKEELETGAINFEGIVGLIEAIKFIASLGDGNLLREQLTSAYAKIEQYEVFLAERLRVGLEKNKRVTLYQAGDSCRKTSTFAFQVEGLEAKMVCYYLAQDYALHLEYGNFESPLLIDKLNIEDNNLVRAGIVLYNTVEEVDRLLHAIEQLK